MKKRILSLLLVLIMVLGMLPVSAMASGSGKVYASVSYDGAYLDVTNGSMAYQEVALSDLQGIDLTEYGLDDYLYDENSDGTYEITALHLLIYTHEILMGLDWDDVNVQGDAGSIFFANGLFGFADCNLQYYLNGDYAAVDGWGVTADQIVLKNGDFIDVAGYSSWAFYSDSAFGFHYFLDNEEITHEYTATAGEALTVTLGRAASYMGEGSSMTKVAGYTVSYGSTFGEADGIVTTGSDGAAEITFAEAGTYYLWIDGGYGNENPTDIVSSPGYAEVTVTAPACAHETWNDATCTTPKTCANCGETEGEADPDAHKYVSGTCEYCGEAEPVSYPFTLTVGSETLEITDLGTIVTCTKTNQQAKEMSVTVPAGTTTVKVNSVNNSIVMMYPNHGDQQIARNNGSVDVSIGTDSYLCLMTVSERILYHIYIEVEPCENHSWADATCETPKTCADCGETEGAADPEAHSYVGGTCEYCGEAEPVTYPFTLTVGSETLEITDLGATESCSCAMVPGTTNKLKVTVPAGTQTITVQIQGGNGYMIDGSYAPSTAGQSVDHTVTGAEGDKICLATLPGQGNGYHIYIEVAPCEEHNWNAATCTTPKTCADCGETEGEADPEAHSYMGGTCEYCGEAEPVSYPFTLTVGGETLEITDLGATESCSCGMMGGTSNKVQVTVPAGTQTITVQIQGGNGYMIDGSYAPSTAGQSVDHTVTGTEGDKICLATLPGQGNGYHIYIEVAPCEEHNWNAATCTTPKTCANCGETEGEADPDAHSYVNGTCEHCGAAEPVATPSYTIKLSEAEELTAGRNYFISVPAEALGKDIIFDFGSGTISGAMCQRHCSKRDIWTAGEGSTMIIAADKVSAHLCNESQRAKVASDFNLYLTEGSQMFAFYWWTSANTNGSYIYIEILPVEDAGGGDEEATYTVTLPTNNVGYSVRATSSPTVTAGGEFAFKLNIYSDYKKGENFKVLANGVELTSSGDTYTITNITANQTVTVQGVVEKTLAEKNVTVIAPAGSVVSSGAFHSYFKYDFVEPLQTSTLEDGRVQYIVPATSGVGGFIRVQNPNGVTYWDFGDLAIGKVFNITEEMLFIGNTEYTKDTVFANYEKNGHDTASLYLTVNAQGWLDMDTGDTHSLNVFRNWIPVANSISNNGVSLPDVEYKVVSIDGTASDVVEVIPDANNSCYADIKAVKAGTAIILVSYDAVYNADGEGGKQFSAIWPENTGVIVVTVDAADANIQTNITVNEEANAGGKQVLDVEHDILFYVGDGAEYSFKPEDGCTVTVARSTVDGVMTFDGFTDEGVTVAEDGTVTLSGLTTGAHIVKVEKDGKIAYQVIRTREVSYKLTHSDGTEVTAENPAQPGETITVQFSKLIDPMGKLSGVYNANFGFYYNGEDGAAYRVASGYAYGDYYFGSNAVRQRFTATVPAEWDSETYTLTDGGIKLGGFGASFGAHRSTTYMEGKEPNLNASGTAGVASVLPDVVIPVYVESTPATYTVTLPSGTGYTVAASGESASPVTEGGSYSFTVTISEGYEAGEDFAVKANDVELTAVEGIYTIENITADQTVTVEGVEVIPTYTVTLPTETTGYTVTAAEGSTSPVTKGGNYSFTVATTDGYEAGEDFAVKANDVELTAVEGIYTIENITADQTVTVEGVVEKQEEPALTWQEVMAKTQAYLTAQAENKAPIISSTKGEWMVLGLARNGVAASSQFFTGYYDNVVRYVEESIDADTGRLDKNLATENARVILALTALGKDVTDVDGHNLLQGLSDTDFVKKQGINGPVWALIALDSHNYEIPTNADSSKQVTRQWLIDYILDNQLEGGGWNISGTAPDDMTPMAVQALAPYYDSDPEVKAAVDKALTIMEGMVENASPETLAQIIVARSTMGLDSEAIVNKMLNFALENGSFKKSPSAATANQMSTEQAFYAMVAYSRFLNNKTDLYDMSDVVIETPSEQEKPVESVTLSDSTLSIKVGKTATLVALVSPADATNRTVSWTSSNTGVATVSATGVVTAVAEGSAIITATAGDKSASCIVTVTKESSSEPKLEFGLTEDEIIGYVTISFEDNATRKNAELSEIESEFRSPLGTIIRSTRVPFKEGDTIASVTLRLLNEKEFTASYEGDEYGSFYLEAIGNFTAKGHYYSSFGEFDAGRDSGWMITWNGWFIDQGASEFEVKNGDVVRWQYTCQLGADIGDVDWNDTPTGGNNTTSEDRAAAREVKALIEAIGTVTKDSGDAIEAARAAYDALTDAQKDLVPNYDDLVAAEKKYAELTKDDTKMVFTDVSESDYYYEAVKWAVELGITKGTSDTTFSPNASCTRAQMVTFLWRAAGEPKAKSTTCVFTDVDENAYYYEALLWAVENGITNGTSDTTFSPDAVCNRGQMATFLYRSAKTPVVSGNHAFNDVKADAYYNDAVIWAAARGITKGTSETTFSPDADCTRGQMVTFLYRFMAE